VIPSKQGIDWIGHHWDSESRLKISDESSINLFKYVCIMSSLWEILKIEFGPSMNVCVNNLPAVTQGTIIWCCIGRFLFNFTFLVLTFVYKKGAPSSQNPVRLIVRPMPNADPLQSEVE
jgi:hypothetical protein